MRAWFLVATLAAAANSAPSAAPTGAPPRTPDCSEYSLEGISLGMTMAEAQAVTQGIKWKENGKPKDGRQEYWVTTRRGETPVGLYVTIAGGAVDELDANYAPYTVKMAFTLGTKANAAYLAMTPGLLEYYTTRLGTPTWTSAGDNMEGCLPRAVWISTPCDRVVLFRSGRRGKMADPVLDVSLQRASTWQAALDARASFAAPAAASGSVPPESASAPASHAAVSPDCSTLSLLGISLGMSISDAKVLTQGAKWWKSPMPCNGRQHYSVTSWETGPLPGVQLGVFATGETIDQLVVGWRTSKLEQRAGQLAALEQAASVRFGEPTCRDASADPHGLVRDRWTDVRCDQVVTVIHGVTDSWYGARTVIGATLSRASAPPAPCDAEAAPATP